MNVFLLAPALYAEGTESAAGNVAPWWVALIVGLGLLALGIVMYLRRKPLTEAERTELKTDPPRINWRVLGPVIIAGVGLWAITRAVGFGS